MKVLIMILCLYLMIGVVTMSAFICLLNFSGTCIKREYLYLIVGVLILWPLFVAGILAGVLGIPFKGKDSNYFCEKYYETDEDKEDS